VTKAFIYTRISTLQQIDGFGISRQINTLMDFLENAELPKGLGYQLDPQNYEVLESDKGLSGYKGHNFTKGSLGKFKNRVANGEITSGCLLIESVDRFSRKQGFDSIEEFTFLIKRNIDIIEVETGQIFSYKLDHNLSQLSTSIERAYQESKRKSRLITKSWRELKRKAIENGIALKRNVPYWLRVENDTYSVKVIEAALIKNVFDMYLNGDGVTSIVRVLNKEHKKYDGKPFSTNFINVMLRDRRVIGWMHGKRRSDEDFSEWERRGIKIYPEIIEQDIFELTQRKIDANKTHKKIRTSGKQRSLFNGMARCAICGEPLVGHFSKKGRYLRCIGKRSKLGTCESNLIRYDACEMAILNYIKGVDLGLVYGRNTDVKNDDKKLRYEMSVVNSEIDEIEQLLLTSTNDKEIIALSRVLREKNGVRKNISVSLAELDAQVLPQNVNVDISISDVVNQDNVTLRESYNKKLKEILTSIKIFQDNSSSEKLLMLNFEYKSSYIMHHVICNLSGEVLASATLEERKDPNEIVMTSSFGYINLMTGVIEFSKDLNEYEMMLLECYDKIINKASQVALSKINNEFHLE
jgi:DNA invertase Pin-like site-specific DNA recombinase